MFHIVFNHRSLFTFIFGALIDRNQTALCKQKMVVAHDEQLKQLRKFTFVWEYCIS